MKRFIAGFLVFIILLSCSGSDNRYNNPFLPNYNFSMSVNLNLPLYSNLNSPINPIKISDPSSGVIYVIMKISDTDFRAWDAYCPNQFPTSCSLMGINGVNAKCACEDFEYSLFSGVGSGDASYTMRPYRVEVINSRQLRVYN